MVSLRQTRDAPPAQFRGRSARDRHTPDVHALEELLPCVRAEERQAGLRRVGELRHAGHDGEHPESPQIGPPLDGWFTSAFGCEGRKPLKITQVGHGPKTVPRPTHSN